MQGEEFFFLLLENPRFPSEKFWFLSHTQTPSLVLCADLPYPHHQPRFSLVDLSPVKTRGLSHRHLLGAWLMHKVSELASEKAAEKPEQGRKCTGTGGFSSLFPTLGVNSCSRLLISDYWAGGMAAAETQLFIRCKYFIFPDTGSKSSLLVAQEGRFADKMSAGLSTRDVHRVPGPRSPVRIRFSRPVS